MGHRMEVYLSEPHAHKAIGNCFVSFNIEARVVGRVEASDEKFDDPVG